MSVGVDFGEFIAELAVAPGLDPTRAIPGIFDAPAGADETLAEAISCSLMGSQLFDC
jgi:hypothetical protein